MKSQQVCEQDDYTRLCRNEPFTKEHSPVCSSVLEDGVLATGENNNLLVGKTSKSLDIFEQPDAKGERKESNSEILESSLSNSLESQSSMLQTVDNQSTGNSCEFVTEEHNKCVQRLHENPGIVVRSGKCSEREPNFYALEPLLSYKSSLQSTSMVPCAIYGKEFPLSTPSYGSNTVSWTNSWFHPSLLSSYYSTWNISKSHDYSSVSCSDSESKVNGCNDLYKTELCRSFMETGFCRYHSKCQFAHGVEELRPVKRHPKYKTRLCKNFIENGTCPYGSRCRFIHGSSGASSFEGLQTDLLLAVQGISLGKERRHSRLPVFQTLEEEKSDISRNQQPNT